MWLLWWTFTALEGCSTPPRTAAQAPELGALAAAYVAGVGERSLAERVAAVRSRPASAGAWSALAQAMVDRTRETGADIYTQYAEDAAAAALAIDPADIGALQVQVRVLFQRHRFAEAAERARALTARFPADATALVLYGDALLELGDYAGALDVFQRALDARPDLRTYNRGAHMRWLYGDVDGAIDLAVRAIRAGGPALPEPTAFCYVDLARYQLHAGRPALAIGAADRALELVPNYPPALSVKSRALSRSHQPAAAVEVLAPLLERRGEVNDLLFGAELLAGLGQREAAERLFGRAEQRASTDPRAMASYLARHGTDLPRALALIEPVQAARPTVENLDTYALVLLRLGRVAEAARVSQRALGLGTADGELHLHHSWIASANGEAEVARFSREKAVAYGVATDPVLEDDRGPR